MTTLKKLDKFTVRDQFGWSRQQILSEANDMAIRHADMMNWESVEIKDITAIPTKTGPYLCYEFEIWGIGSSNLADNEGSTESQSVSIETTSKVAKQPEL